MFVIWQISDRINQGLSNYGPWVKTGHQPVFERSSLNHSHALSFMECLCLLLLWTVQLSPAKPKLWTNCPFIKFAKHWSRVSYKIQWFVFLIHSKLRYFWIRQIPEKEYVSGINFYCNQNHVCHANSISQQI